MKLQIDQEGYLTCCSGIGKELRLPPEVRGINGIPSSAFVEGCDMLERLILPPTVEWVGSYSLCGAPNLKELIVEGANTRLDNYSCWCDQLESIVFPPEHREIENCAFYGTKWIKKQPYSAWIRGGTLLCYDGDDVEFEIPAEVTSIGEDSFSALRKLPLAAIHIGKQVERIGRAAFYYCENLAAVYFEGDPFIEPNAFDETPWLKKQGDFFVNHNRLLRYTGNAEQVAVPDGITEICMQAFELNENIRSVVMPQTMKAIGFNAFVGCARLHSVTLPEGLREITYRAFAGCEALEEITLPASVYCVWPCAFSNCKKLKHIDRTKHYIEFCSGSFYNCDALRQHADEYGIPAEAFELKPVRRREN